MSSIDRRVVEMEFDNRQFERGIRETLSSLEALKKGLTLDGAKKGLRDLDDAGKKFSLGGMADAVSKIADRFSALGAIGFTIINRLTNASIDFAKRAAGLVWDPLVAGGKRRALNIEQAKFMFRGLGMDIEQAMGDALFAVQGTAFGLDEAARAASQLGASQVELGDDMRTALRGISGVAAMTNSTYEDTARIFTRVAGQGRVMAVDLNSIAARGLNAAAVLGDALGKSEADIREMVTQGEISFDIFSKAMDDAFGENATKANETYSGSLANLRAALSRIGASFFTHSLEHHRDIFNAMTPAIDAVGKALAPIIDLMVQFSRSGADKLIAFFESLDFERLELLGGPLAMTIRNIVNALGSLLKPIREAFREIFPAKTLKDARAFLLAIQSFTFSLKIGEDTADKLRRTFAGVFAIFGIGFELIKAGIKFFAEFFGIVFDGNLGILDVTASIGDFLVAVHTAIKDGGEFTKFFSDLIEFLRPAIEFVKNLSAALMTLFEFDAPSVERISEAFRAFEPLTTLGELIVKVWSKVAASWSRIWAVFQPIAAWLGDIFSPVIRGISEAFSELDFDRIIDIINTSLFGGIVVLLNRFVKNMGSSMGSAIHRLTAPFARLTFTLNTMQNTLRAMTLMSIAIAVGLLTASVVALSTVDSAGLTRALSAISAMFAQLFLAMAGISRIGGIVGLVGISTGLILLATALRLMVWSVRALAKLDWEDMARGLTGVTALIAALIVATRGLTGHSAGMIKAGAGLLILSFAIRNLAEAVGKMSGLDWEEMAKGLTGVGALLAALAIFTRLVAANKAGVLQGAGLLLLATGIRILANAVSIFAALGWEEIAKGLVSVGGILLAFAGFSQILDPKGLVRAGLSLVLIGSAMLIMGEAMKTFAAFSWEEIGKGLATMAGALLAVVLALNLMPPSTIASAIALVIVSTALGMIATALKNMGGMSWEEIAKGLVTLAGSLIIIAGAMALMTAALPGALATFVVASALRVLAPVLEHFAGMSIGEMARSLGMLAAVFVVLGLAALVLSPIVPVLLGIGAGIALIGAGVMLAGTGIFLFAAGLTALAVAGAGGAAAIVAIGSALIGLLPVLARGLAEALVIFAEVIALAAPAMLDAIITVMESILDGIIRVSPKIMDTFEILFLDMLARAETFIPAMAATGLAIMLGVLREFEKKSPTIVATITRLIVGVLREMRSGLPRIIREGTELILAFLRGIERNVGRVIRAGADIIIAVIRGISANMVRIANEGMKAIVNFVNGLADAIRRNRRELNAAGRNLASALVEGITGGLGGSAIRGVATAAANVARSALNAAKTVLGVRSPSKEFEQLFIFAGEGMVIGMNKSGDAISRAAGEAGEGAVNTMKKSIAGLSDILDMDTDLHPTITPVLDLSQFDKSAARIGATLSDREFSVDVTYEKAKDASTRYSANEAARNVTSTDEEVTPQSIVTYNQYNTSPKELSSAEIYRQTKNQLSVTKGALKP